MPKRLAWYLITPIQPLSGNVSEKIRGAVRLRVSEERNKIDGKEKRMCRLFAVNSLEAVSPMRAIDALNVMKEGHDGSGVGLFMRDLGGEFEEFKHYPILSGIFTHEGLRRVDEVMFDMRFTPKHQLSFDRKEPPPSSMIRRDKYLVRAYEPPDGWDQLSEPERARRCLEIRLMLRRLGFEDKSGIVYSFWPDVIMIKEIGDPVEVGKYLGLDREGLMARIILAQGRQNTNYAITLYACHPFFIQGYSTMTNGENTAFVPIREYLASRGFPGYVGYESDSEVFTHILHYVVDRLSLDLMTYKHVITPLRDEELDRHPDGAVLRQLKYSLRYLTIDGPNCVIGCLPDRTVFLTQDSKKLRPGVVGGRPGLYAFSSEICGLESLIPDRNKAEDVQPMGTDMVSVDQDRQEIRLWSQWDRYTFSRAA